MDPIQEDAAYRTVPASQDYNKNPPYSDPVGESPRAATPAPAPSPNPGEATRQYNAWLATSEGQAASADDRTRKESQLAQAYPATPAKPPLSSVTMSPDEYTAAFVEQRSAAVDAKEAAMKQRQAAENDALKSRHDAEGVALASEREEIKAEGEAVKLYVEMWKRQSAETSVAQPPEIDRLRVRHETERAALARKTGFDIRPPTIGGRTYAGYPAVTPGHPWIRPTV